MNTISTTKQRSTTMTSYPSLGDVGEPLRHIITEPVEVPLSIPVPEEVPA